MFHRSLKFYCDGIAHFHKLSENELVDFLEKLKMTHQSDIDMFDAVSNSLANTLAVLLGGTQPTSHDRKSIMIYAEEVGFFVSMVGFLYDLLPARIGGLSVSTRDHLLERFYFSIRDVVDTTAEVQTGLVNNLIKLQDEINQKAEENYINDLKALVAETIAATNHNTSSVLTYAFAVILTHLHVAKKIQEEIDSIVGYSRLPNDCDREHMHYFMRFFDIRAHLCWAVLI